MTDDRSCPAPFPSAATDPSSSARWRRRRASALLIVVLLVILLAIIGTAYLTTSRTDRVSAIQNNENTQIDMLVDGVVNMVKSSVTDELYSYADSKETDPSFRPADSYYGGHWTRAGAYKTKWLASRIPDCAVRVDDEGGHLGRDRARTIAENFDWLRSR